jgi:hypothetical protein
MFKAASFRVPRPPASGGADRRSLLITGEYRVNRREFLSGAAGCFAALWRRAARAATRSPATTPRLSIGEHWPYVSQPAQKIQWRFDLYRQIGFGTLRSGIEWRQLEMAEGSWRDPPFLTNYLKQAIDNGFRLKLTIGTLGAPPGWYLEAHPDARIRNASSEYSVSDLSLWYPGLYALLADKTDVLFDYLVRYSVFAATDFIFVDLGPASEPIYPAPWTMGEAQAHGPWFYDEHAEAAFVSAMQGKHPSLGGANHLWGANFATWREVRLPSPGENPGALWQDALLWYRDSKRHFIRWQVDNYRRALRKYAPSGVRTQLIIMVPGSHIQPDEWQEAVRSGDPDSAMTIMTDSEFLLELAQETGCWLQYTGVENDKEVSYLRQYMNHHDIDEPMWGENAGVEAVARNPEHLADVVLAHKLYGLEYISSAHLFRPDGVTPNDTYGALSHACQRLRQRPDGLPGLEIRSG